MEKVPIVFEALVLALAGLVVLVQILTHRTLVKLQNEDPDVLLSVGVKSVDWWFDCIKGVFLLAFGAAGISIDRKRRLLLRLFWISQASLFGLLVAGQIIWRT